MKKIAGQSSKHSTNEMTILSHLGELRIHIVRAALAIAIGAGISLVFAERIIQALIEPYGGYLQVLEPTEGISVFLRVGLTCGVALASPVVVHQVLSFVAPGLTKRERRALWMLVPGALLLFGVGAAFAWFLMIPAAIDFLAHFMPSVFRVEWSSRGYVPFVLSLTLWIGLSFEMPLVVLFLARIGLVTPASLMGAWRIAVVVIAILAAAITPTVDPFNMLLVMAPLLGLYCLSILLAVIPYRARQRSR